MCRNARACCLFGLVKNLVWMKEVLIAADQIKQEKKEAGKQGVPVAGAAKADDDGEDVVGPSPAKTRKRPPKA